MIFLKRVTRLRIATQIFLLMLVSIGIVHVFTMVQFKFDRQMQETSSNVFLAASSLKLLSATQTVAEQKLLAQLASQQGLIITFEHDRGQFPADERGLPGPFHFLSETFNDLRIKDTENGMQMAYPLQNGQIAVASVERPKPPFPHLPFPLIILVVCTAVFTLWAVRWLTAPLDHLAKAADAFGRTAGDAPARALEEQGPTEIVKVSRAFNAMRQRIGQLLEQRSRMLTAISHDMRTPLTRLRLRAEKVGDEAIRLRLVEDIERIDLLLHETLEYFRTGRQIINPELHDLADILRNLVQDYQNPAVVYHGPETLIVACDDAGIWRAVTNVIENGLRYAGSAAVHLSLTPDSMVSIAISDTGAGLSDALKQQVMEPFFRLDTARGQRNQDGFGLGLSIVHNIMALHNGTVTLNDNVPHGLVVEMVFPQQYKAPHV